MRKIIITIILINLILLPWFNLASANDNFYNKNKVYFLNQNDVCFNNQLNLTTNRSIGPAKTRLSKDLIKINDPDKFAQAIDKWISQVEPTSPMIGLGKYAVAGGQKAGINPILPIVIARKESSLATKGSLSKRAFNAYGRMATDDQPHIGTARKWYKWDSFEDSLLSQNNEDMYHYLARVYADQSTIEKVILKYAPPSENDTQTYINQIKIWADQIYQLAGDSIDQQSLGSKISYNYSDCKTSAVTSIDNMIMYYQYQSPWANHQFDPSCGNIKKCGCGPTSIAIVTANLLNDRSITPISISDQMIGMKSVVGTYWSAFKKIPSKYHLRSKFLGTNLNLIDDELKQGNLIIASMGPGIFTISGHIIVIRGKTDQGKILVADPNSRKFTENNSGFTTTQINQSLRGMWSISR